MFVLSTGKTIPIAGVVPIVAPLVQLLLLSLTPKLLTLINNPLCYSTDQINNQRFN